MIKQEEICYFCHKVKTDCTQVVIDHEYPDETVAVCDDCLKDKCVQCDDCGKWLANQNAQSEPFLVFGSQGRPGYEAVEYIDNDGNRTYSKQCTHWINEPQRGVCGQCYDANYSQCVVCKRDWCNKDLVDAVIDGKSVKICPDCANSNKF